MKCPDCGNGKIVAYQSVSCDSVLFYCVECNWATSSLTRVLEEFKEQIIKEIKEEALWDGGK